MRRCDGGFTLVETMVALTVLLGGTTLFIWQMQQQSRVETGLLHKQLALESARSEMESLQGLMPNQMHDTEYTLDLMPGFSLKLIREVVDSLDIMQASDMQRLDENLKPYTLREPREVKVSVFENSGESTESGKESVPLVQISSRIAEYLW
jgi:prepilin-type N-terminal cleavage/methylation domain-containing protein